MAPYVSKKEATVISMSTNEDPAQSKNASRHLVDKCQLKKNEANFCSILEAFSHPKLLNEACNEIEFLQYPVLFIYSIIAT